MLTSDSGPRVTERSMRPYHLSYPPLSIGAGYQIFDTGDTKVGSENIDTSEE